MNIVRAALFSLCVALVLLASTMQAQTTNANVNGLVVDSSGAVVVGASVQAINEGTNVGFRTTSNSEGVYALPNLPPGRYRIQVEKTGFKTLIKPDIILNVQDARAVNFTLQVGATSEVVTVEGGTPLVDTQSATVSTVVDRQFAENLPLNGRSFQTLIQLTPGVTLTAQTSGDSGQFSVNGQRASSNYWMVDGVSANIGIGAAGGTPGNGLAGTLGSFSTMGGTNSLVSVDALQEFRIETSTYAPEFGRTPGGQISIVTRSGTNQIHGTGFDYFRNDALDANDWFADNAGSPKQKERQNDFGGTLGGPILKDRTFFFFSYEGLRLRLPQFAQTFVPDASYTPQTTNSRQNASSVMQPYFAAFPLPNPNSPEVFTPCDPTIPPCPSSGQQPAGYAAFNAGYSDKSTLDAYSLRIDHKLTNKLSLFARYDYSPSQSVQRGVAGGTLSTITTTEIKTQTGTVGALWSLTTQAANDLRFNYSSVISERRAAMDSFGGAVPLSPLPFPSPFTSQDSRLVFGIGSLITNNGQNDALQTGNLGHNHQRQYNFVDTFSLQRGAHAIKLGIDYRRLSPQFHPFTYDLEAFISDVASAESGSPASPTSFVLSIVNYNTHADLLFRNLGVYAQDTWRVTPRLNLTYGLRWDLDFVPSSLSGPGLNAVTGFNLGDLSNLALAPAGTSPYKTKYGNVAPRVGLTYQLSQSSDWQTVVRGGFGVFYDLATAEAGNNVAAGYYPFGAQTFSFSFPPPSNSPPVIAPPNASNFGILFGFDPNLRSPYTLQWNAAVEQGLGRSQSISASYIGSVGRRLIQTADIVFPPNFPPNNPLFEAELVTNGGTSDYNSLQIQFRRRMARGFQALASYVWAHSIDTASASSIGNASNALIGLDPNLNRGPSDFDIRNAFSAALTYDVPAHEKNALFRAILKGWSTENVIQVRSAPPVDLYYSIFGQLSNGFFTNPRPDVVPGQPFYLFGSSYPGGKAFNPAAFTSPPIDPSTFLPIRQGDLGRNALRGFGAAQWDFAVHRDFPIREGIKLQFRAELFNLLNHPNFGPPVGDLSSSQFGHSTKMLGRSLAGNGGAGQGGFDPLYQIGGPRSIQLALKLFF